MNDSKLMSNQSTIHSHAYMVMMNEYGHIGAVHSSLLLNIVGAQVLWKERYVYRSIPEDKNVAVR